MVEINGITYNQEGLMESKNFKVVIAYSDELKSICYHAQRKSTSVLEVPFRLLSDSQAILQDLEDYTKDVTITKPTKLASVH